MNKFNNNRRGGFGGGFNNRNNNRGDRRDFGRSNIKFDAVCPECGKNCRVPFKPNGDKPVFCDSCFNQRGGGRELGRVAGATGSLMRSPENFSANDIKTQLAMLNIKLDKVLKTLTPDPVSAPIAEIKTEEEISLKPVKKSVKTKKTSKK